MKQILAIIAAALCLTAATAQRMLQKGKTELSMERQGMVDVQQKDSSIRVSLMYSRADNFTGEVLYTDLRPRRRRG